MARELLRSSASFAWRGASEMRQCVNVSTGNSSEVLVACAYLEVFHLDFILQCKPASRCKGSIKSSANVQQIPCQVTISDYRTRDGAHLRDV